jgi:DNA-binding response OmpR family regulator
MKSRSNLLVVEENLYLTSVLEQTLKTDFNITVATSGDEAVRLLIGGNKFDLVITELELTHFSGFKLVKLIRTSMLLRHIPILVLSGSSDSETRITCLEEGADECITKPFNPLEVKAKLHAMLRRTKAQIFQAEAPTVPHYFKKEFGRINVFRSRLSSILRSYSTTLEA